MAGKKIGYIRVSCDDQNPDRQLNEVSLDRRFVDRCSGKDVSRPELQALIEYARDGDIVYVHSMDRLARNLDDLRTIITTLNNKEVKVEFINEGLAFTGEDSSLSKLLLSVMGAFAEFERSLVRERQREGIALAKKRGAYKGRKPSLSQEQKEEIKQLVAEGHQKTKIARDFNISRETLYQYLRSN